MSGSSYYSIVLSLLLLSSVSLFKAEAQRRVVVTKPSRTVVITKPSRSEVVYVNRRVVRPPVVVGVLPPTSVTIVHRHSQYYFHAGVYYIQRPEGYVVVNPPVGIMVTNLPSATLTFTFSSRAYFFIGGAFYIQIPGGFQIVNAPAGAKISQLPEGAEKVVVGDEIYYEQYGTLYKKVETEQGIAYIIAGSLQS